MTLMICVARRDPATHSTAFSALRRWLVLVHVNSIICISLPCHLHVSRNFPIQPFLNPSLLSRKGAGLRMQLSLVSAGPPPLLECGCSERPCPASRLRTASSAGVRSRTHGEAGAGRRGWGRGMASRAAQGGWNKRRRRGRRKKLGEESSGREGRGAERALASGRRREPGRARGRAPARGGGAGRPWGGRHGGGARGRDRATGALRACRGGG